VTAHDWDLRELLEEEGQSRLRTLLEKVNVVCVTGHGKEATVGLNKLCRSLDRGIKFYSAHSWGFFGFSFTDLGKGYTFLTEEASVSTDSTPVTLGEGLGSDSGENGGEPAKKKMKTQDQENQKQIVEKSLDFPSLETALGVKAGKVGVGLTKRTNPVLILVHIMFAFYSKNKRYPDPDPKRRTSDIEELKQLQLQVIESLGVDDSFIEKLDSLVWWEKAFGELSPVTSIVGGVVGQDVIRAVTGKDSPIKNCFLFNGIQSKGFIETVGK
jgi:ubiquitin-like 1-activating enzyme E1 A